jgi:hypothetical protein
MVASLLKIVSTGIQDERLQPPKDQPNLDAFLTVIIKAGRYATKWARIDFDTQPNFGQTGVIRIPTQGELVGRILLVTEMPDIMTQQLAAQKYAQNNNLTFVGPHFSWTNSLGHALINNVSLSIGGTVVDTIPGKLMEIIDEFQTPLEKVVETSRQLCRKLSGFAQTSFGTETTSQKVVTNLPFWFSRGDPGCVLPIDALNVDEVRISVQYNPINSVYYTDSRSLDLSGNVIKNNVDGSSLWPLQSSPFYYSNTSGTAVPGLEPITNLNTKVSLIPNINIANTLNLTGAHLLVEYIYLDKPEANRFRIADIQVPVVQHYAFNPVDNQQNNYARIRLTIPNPARDLFFYCQRYEAPGYNAHFLGSRDLSNNQFPNAPWWPDATGLDDHQYGNIRAGFSTRFSEPIRWLSLDYAETLNRYTTENVALFRSIIPSIEQRKAPFINRYYYNIPFGSQNGFTPFSMPIGEANLDKVLRLNLSLGFHGKSGILTDAYVNRFNTYIFAETYNIFRVYGGRGTMMFAY